MSKTYTDANAREAPEGYYWFKECDRPWRVVHVNVDVGFCTYIFVSDSRIFWYYQDDYEPQERIFTMIGPIIPPDDTP